MKILTLIALLSVAAFSADYRTMSTIDMQAMKGSVPEADRAAFQSEMQTRVQDMSASDRQNMQQNKSGSQDGSGSQMRKGSGQGGNSSGSMQHRGGK